MSCFQVEMWPHHICISQIILMIFHHAMKKFLMPISSWKLFSIIFSFTQTHTHTYFFVCVCVHCICVDFIYGRFNSNFISTWTVCIVILFVRVCKNKACARADERQRERNTFGQCKENNNVFILKQQSQTHKWNVDMFRNAAADAVVVGEVVHHNQVVGMFLILFSFWNIQKFCLNSVKKGVKAVNIHK